MDEQRWDKLKGLMTDQLIDFLSVDVLGIVLEYAQRGLTISDAHANRAALMYERKMVVDSHNRSIEREFSLCEH